MQAIVQDGYGSSSALSLANIDRPAVKDDEVLIRVRAAAVTMADWYLTRGEPYVARLASGLRRPRCAVRGRDVAGQIEAVGRSVTDLRPGDAVYAEVDTGSFAEYGGRPGGPGGADAGQPHLRAGRGDSRGGLLRAAGPAR